MSKEVMNKLTRELGTFIENQQNHNYPLIGVITYATSNYQYCDIRTDTGTFKDVPAHGLPVVGDSAIIHFINGNSNMPVADCARRLPASTETVNGVYSSECFNYLDNGDFHLASIDSMTGNFELILGESYTLSSEYSCILREQDDYIEVTVDISNCSTDYFKFQCVYMGNGSLKVECFDTDTGSIIQNLPYTCSYDYKIWTNPYGRNAYSYNKEVYPRQEDDITHNHITIRITNNTTPQQTRIGDTIQEVPHAMLLDALLVYDENGDKEYYNSVNDVITND